MSRRAATSWLRGFDVRTNPQANMLCFPYAAGAVSTFRRLSAMLAEEIQTFSVQHPGRQGRLGESALDSIDAFADAAYREILTLPSRPTVLLGHSMGATVAFEVVSRLAGAAIPIVGLVVSARSAPSYREPTCHHLDD